MQQNQPALFVDRLFTSPYAMSAFVTLREKGIVFAMEKIDLDAGQQQQTAYLERSLTARVPERAKNGCNRRVINQLTIKECHDHLLPALCD